MASKTYYHTVAGSRFIFGGDKDNKNGLAGKIIYFAEGKYITADAAEQAELDAAIRAGGSQITDKSEADLVASIKAARAELAKPPAAPAPAAVNSAPAPNAAPGNSAVA